MSDISVDVDRFRQDGVLVVPGLLDEAEIIALRAQAEWVASGQAEHVASARIQVEPRVACGEERADNYANSLRKMIHIAFCDEIFAAHASNRKILDVVEALLGTDLRLYQDQFFMKPPRVGSRQPYTIRMRRWVFTSIHPVW